MTGSRSIDTPEPGYFAIRLVRRGPWVAARIVHDESGWWAIIDGVRSPPHIDPVYADDVFRIWHGGRIIEETEYNHILNVREWARKQSPDHPSANPREPIDIAKKSPLF